MIKKFVPGVKSRSEPVLKLSTKVGGDGTLDDRVFPVEILFISPGEYISLFDDPSLSNTCSSFRLYLKKYKI